MAKKRGSIQSQGGIARAAKLTADERKAIASAAARARWESDCSIPRATHGSVDRPLRIGDLELPCFVLEDGRRAITFKGMIRALGMSRGGAGYTGGEGDRLARFAAGKSIKPFISSDLAEGIAS